MARMFKWVVEIEVSETWVADGFELTPERAKAMIETELPYSYSHETTVKIVSSPSASDIRKAQGLER